MSSFIEFQALVLGKLCSIEERISDIEGVLGISRIPSTDDEPEQIVAEAENVEKVNNDNGFKDEISDFHKQLDDIKSLFSESDN